MAKKILGYEAPPSLAIASGATTPNPGIVGIKVWSTTLSALVVWDGANWYAVPSIGTTLSASSAVATDASQRLVSVANTGTGSNVLATSPTLVTPALGTPTALVGTNITGTAASLTSGITNALKSATTTVSVSAATAPTTGQVLTATSGTAATWQTAAGGGGALVLLSTVTASAAGTADVETGFSSTYDDYMIIASGIISSTASTGLSMRFRMGGTYVTAASYYYNIQKLGLEDALYDAEFGSGTTSSLATPAAGLGTGIPDASNVTVHLCGVNNAATKTYDVSGANCPWSNRGGDGRGLINSTSVLSGVRFFATTGNITGTFKLYGIAKA